MGKSRPIFSIILPTYERPEMLARAVHSVQQQSFGDFELIIVDDGSRNEYASRFKAVDRRIRCIRCHKNRGAAAARNAGIRAARGEYISFLDDDDEYCHSFLSSTYQKITDVDEEVDLVWTSVKIQSISSDGNEVTQHQLFPSEFESMHAGQAALLSIGTGYGVTVQSDVLSKIGYFDEGLLTAEDTDWFIRFLIHQGIAKCVSSVEIVLHDHNLARLTSLAMNERNIAECQILLDRHKKFFASYPELGAQLSKHKMWLESELQSSKEQQAFLGKG